MTNKEDFLLRVAGAYCEVQCEDFGEIYFLLSRLVDLSDQERLYFLSKIKRPHKGVFLEVLQSTSYALSEINQDIDEKESLVYFPQELDELINTLEREVKHAMQELNEFCNNLPYSLPEHEKIEIISAAQKFGQTLQ